MSFVVVVCGGRNYNNFEFVSSVLDKFHFSDSGPIDILIHGACGWDASKPRQWTTERLRGADALTEKWWNGFDHRDEFAPGILRRPADWSFGSKGGPVRNAQMAKEAKRWSGEDDPILVAFPGGRGTANMVGQFRKRGWPVVTPVVTEHP